MSKTLIVKFPQKCIGCELCVHEIQRQLNIVGLEDSKIRVFKNFDSEIKYTITLDSDINNYDIAAIKKICPTGVFEIEENTNTSQDELIQTN